jgi:ribosomal protein L37AE/L43A
MINNLFLNLPGVTSNEYNPNGRMVMKKILNELTTRFECENCGKCKPARHFNDMVCSSVCDNQYRDGGFYMYISK